MNYLPPWWLRNGHVQSIYPSLFRRIDDSWLQRERIATPDGDFLDLDWHRQGSKRLLVISHGLEGHSRRPYVLGMAKAAANRGWDILTWNFRSCSGETNRHLYSYHSGSTEDMALLLNYAAEQNYQEIAQVGFSIGGNKTLLYLARHAHEVPVSHIGAVALSVPCDLSSSSRLLGQRKNALYMQNFLRSLREKLEAKKSRFPDEIDLEGFEKIRDFKTFDDRYTAPINDFASAEDYWTQCSSLPDIPGVSRPVLLLSAEDDPFLTPECYPYREAARTPLVTLEVTRYGGHVGFMSGGAGEYWSEQRSLDYLDTLSRYPSQATTMDAADPTPVS